MEQMMTFWSDYSEEVASEHGIAGIRDAIDRKLDAEQQTFVDAHRADGRDYELETLTCETLVAQGKIRRSRAVLLLVNAGQAQLGEYSPLSSFETGGKDLVETHVILGSIARGEEPHVEKCTFKIARYQLGSGAGAQIRPYWQRVA